MLKMFACFPHVMFGLHWGPVSGSQCCPMYPHTCNTSAIWRQVNGGQFLQHDDIPFLQWKQDLGQDWPRRAIPQTMTSLFWRYPLPRWPHPVSRLEAPTPTFTPPVPASPWGSGFVISSCLLTASTGMSSRRLQPEVCKQHFRTFHPHLFHPHVSWQKLCPSSCWGQNPDSSLSHNPLPNAEPCLSPPWNTPSSPHLHWPSKALGSPTCIPVTTSWSPCFRSYRPPFCLFSPCSLSDS